MSNQRFPPEILDYMVDLLRDDPNALEGCCLVSKSWIHRARKHLFARIRFSTGEKVQLWEKMFPDPSSSPAYHTHTLSIVCSSEIAATGRGAGEWIKAFSRVVNLCVASPGSHVDPMASFDLLHGFSPVVKSLHANLSAVEPSRVFDLILSFPLLEDLTVMTHSKLSVGGEMSTAVQPLNPPVFTGSLEVYMEGGMGPIARRLLSLSGGIHFRVLNFGMAP